MTATGMNAMGQEVPHERVAAGESLLRLLLPSLSSGDRLSLLSRFVTALEDDAPAVLLCPSPPGPLSLLDLTGRYRLVAVLLSG